MSLRQWASNGWVVAHTTSATEIQDLFDLADRDLADCQTARLSDDWRFGIACNAALQLATAALYASGYKPARGQSHHLRAVQSLEFTIAADATLVNQFDAFRAKRNTGTYDRAGAVSRAEADEMRTLAKTLRKRIAAWLTANHPPLAPRER